MATTKKKPNPRAAQPALAFHADLVRLRESGYIDPSVVAGTAGVTLRVYRAMELGEIPISAAVYDAAVQRFPQLRAHPRPSASSSPISRVVHPAVALEYARVEPFVERAKRLNIGTTNRGLVKELLRVFVEHDLTLTDVERYL